MGPVSLGLDRLRPMLYRYEMSPDGSDPQRRDPPAERMARWPDGEPDAYLDGVAAEIARDPSALTPVSDYEREHLDAWLSGSGGT